MCWAKRSRPPWTVQRPPWNAGPHPWQPLGHWQRGSQSRSQQLQGPRRRSASPCSVHWRIRVAAAKTGGVKVKVDWRAVPTLLPRLRARVLVAVDGQMILAGLCSRLLGGAREAARASPPCHVVGYTSVEDVEGFLAGLGVEVLDRCR